MNLFGTQVQLDHLMWKSSRGRWSSMTIIPLRDDWPACTDRRLNPQPEEVIGTAASLRLNLRRRVLELRQHCGPLTVVERQQLHGPHHHGPFKGTQPQNFLAAFDRFG